MKRRKAATRCRWCRTLTVPMGGHHTDGYHSKGGVQFRCLNPECPRKGQVPWVLPTMSIPNQNRRLPRHEQEDNPGFEDAVRAIEDSLS